MLITRNKALTNWRNFVLEFRKDFDLKYQCEGAIQSLSLLVSALAIKVSLKAQVETSDTRQHQDRNPKYPNRSALELADAIALSEALHKKTKRAVPSDLRYELLSCASNCPEEFLTILDAIDMYEIRTDPYAIGYTYQYWRDRDRKAAQSSIQSADKSIDRDNLIAFTQIYTPDWVVNFILSNTLLPLLNPEQASQSVLSDWLVSNDQRTDRSSETVNLRNVSILDPAAGAGNFLIGAFDALLDLHLKAGQSKPEAIKRILSEQLHGCDIDPVALSVAAAALVSRCVAAGCDAVPVLNGLALSLPENETLLGSLSDNFEPSHPLAKKHDVVVTNPPYIGRKLMSRELKRLMKSRFPDNHHDLSSAFFERTLTLLKPGGRAGLITQASVMHLPSHTKLRELLLDQYRLISAVDAGPGVFPLQGGEKVNSAILIVEKPGSASPTFTSGGVSEEVAHFFNLKNSQQKREELKAQIAGTSVADRTAQKPVLLYPSLFRQYHGCAFNYNIPPSVAQLLKRSPLLESITEIRQGLATTDNDRFVKYIWQVPREELNKIWFPYVKGAGGQRFHSPVRHVINWQNSGAEIKEEVARRYPYLNGKTAWVVKNESFYFQKGLCFSFVNTRGIAVRNLPPDCIFDVGASAIFSAVDQFLLAYLNSSFMVALANSMNPTINYQVGDLKRFPVVQMATEAENKLALLSSECAEIKAELSALVDPTSWFDPTVIPRHNESSPSSDKLSASDTLNAAVLESRHPRLLSHALYSSVKQLGFETTFSQFVDKLHFLEAQLKDREDQIDSLVIDAISLAEGWTDSTRADVLRWIESFNTKGLIPAAMQPEQVFLDNIAIRELLEAAPSLNLPMPPLSGATRSSIETLIGSSLSRYLDSSFQTRINKIFLGFPPESLRSISPIS